MLLAFLPLVVSAATPDIVYDFAITVDAGSSGSRAYIYKWERRHAPGSIPPFSFPITQHGWSDAVRPGISSFLDKPEDASSAILPLVDWAKKQLRDYRARYHEIPFFLKATAGMRTIKHLATRDRIMNTIRDMLSDPAYSPFKFERTYARVISGEEEGVYGWLSVNYLAQTLINTPTQYAYGALDLGGASTQITFRPLHDVLAGYFPIRLRQEKIRLYSHSFLYMGYAQAKIRINNHLINPDAKPRAAVGEPVESTPPDIDPLDVPSNATKPIEIENTFSHHCYPKGYSYNYTDPYDDKLYVFEGDAKHDTCFKLLYDLLRKGAECWSNTCSFAGVYQPRLESTSFIAFSGFEKVVVQELKMPWDVSLKTLGRETNRVCGLTYEQLKKQFSHVPPARLPDLCFNAQYIFILLHHGFNMDLLGTRILFLSQINGVHISWPLGSTIYEINAMPWDIEGCPDAPGATSFAHESADKPAVPFRDSPTESDNQPFDKSIDPTRNSIDQPPISSYYPTSNSLTTPMYNYAVMNGFSRKTHSPNYSGLLPLFLLLMIMTILFILLLALYKENKKLKKRLLRSETGYQTFNQM